MSDKIIVKLKNKKKPLPRSNSFCGYHCSVWEAINTGEEVEVDLITEFANPYVKTIIGE